MRELTFDPAPATLSSALPAELDTDDRAYFKAIATCPACDKRFEQVKSLDVV
jgi:hypothetical protein